jgi:hypothetical protein
MRQISSKAGPRKEYDSKGLLAWLNNSANDNKGRVIFGNPGFNSKQSPIPSFKTQKRDETKPMLA